MEILQAAQHVVSKMEQVILHSDSPSPAGWAELKE
mgnify:CR=1 FL=1